MTDGLWLSAQQLAGLPGMPGTDRGAKMWAEKNLSVSRPKVRGKGLEYRLDLNKLPAGVPVSEFLAAVSVRTGAITAETHPTSQPDATPALPVAVVTPPAAPGLSTPAAGALALADVYHHDKTAKQRAEETARKATLAAVDRLMRSAGCSREAALTTLLITARSTGELADTLKLARDGRGRKSPDGLPSVRSLKRWLSAKTHGQDLAPAVRAPDMSLQPWHRLVVQLKQRPQGSTTRWVAEQVAAQWRPEWGEKPPSYDVIARFLREKYSQFDVLVGRHTGMDLKSHMPYQPRTREGLWPAMEAHADGWCTHFTAPHPVTGEFVTYEVWTAVDFATGYPATPAIGLTESYEVITKCLELYIREFGVPAVFQTDSTGSVKNDRFEFDGIASLQSRIGFKIVHPAMVAVGKGNSQANGMVESLHAWYDLQARELATYQGKGMDGLTLKRVKRLTAALAKATDVETRAKLKMEAERAGKGIVFKTFQQARDWFLGVVERRRDTPSRGLPKIDDPATGRRRHMTPREMLARYREQGWQPVAMTEAEIIDSFRPHVRKTVRRGMVSPFGGQLYSHPDLIHHNGAEVLVAVDIMDPWRVWVKDLDGRLIGEAAYVQGRLPRPKSMYQDADDRRRDAQIKRRENQIEAIDARRPSNAIESPAGEVIPFAQHAPIDLPAEAITHLPDAGKTSTPMSLEDLARMLAPEPAQDVRPPMRGEDLAMWLYGKDGGDTPPKESAAG